MLNLKPLNFAGATIFHFWPFFKAITILKNTKQRSLEKPRTEKHNWIRIGQKTRPQNSMHLQLFFHVFGTEFWFKNSANLLFSRHVPKKGTRPKIAKLVFSEISTQVGDVSDKNFKDNSAQQNVMHPIDLVQ